ncbi:MAG TPA: hypothetical protein VIE37_12270 [Methylomirabilota bacterium]|jgi:hypothetical protein
MKTLFAVSLAVVAALTLAVSPVQAGSAGFEHRPSAFPKPVDHWAHWGKPAPTFHGHVHRPTVPHFTVPVFTVPHFTVPRPVVVPHGRAFVAPRRVWVPGFYSWSGFYWVWIPGHWR